MRSCDGSEHSLLEAPTEKPVWLETGWVPTLQRLVGHGNDLDRLPMHGKKTLKGFKEEGCQDSKISKMTEITLPSLK
jgi:hypothetical protein